MEDICIEYDTLYYMIHFMVQRIKDMTHTPYKWISARAAISKLGVGADALQKLSDEGKIRSSRATMENIMYDLDSINNYIKKRPKTTF